MASALKVDVPGTAAENCEGTTIPEQGRSTERKSLDRSMEETQQNLDDGVEDAYGVEGTTNEQSKRSSQFHLAEGAASTLTSTIQCRENIGIPRYTEIHTDVNGPDGISGIVDSALLSAMRDGRERFALLRLEQTMVEFMKNSAIEYIDVGGPYNGVVHGLGKQTNEPGFGRQTSFQRCWLHRLADRFNIVREPTTHIDGLIRCVKTAESAIPNRLLINLEPHEYATDGELAGVNGAMSNVAISNKPSKRKMKIMKRSSSNQSSSSLKEASNDKPTVSRSNSGGLKGKNLGDKEKAYAAARARIFNEGDYEEDKVSQEDDKHHLLSLQPSQIITVDPSVVRGSAESSFIEDSPPPSSAISSSEGHLRNRPAAATMGGVSKVTWRNRQQEENDPDFRRGGGMTNNPYSQADYMYPQGYQQHYQQQYYQKSYPEVKGYYVQQQPFHHQGQQGRGRGRGQSQGHYGGRYSSHSTRNRYGRHAAGGRGDGRANVNSLDDFPALR